jgi:hypothetical protein
VRAIAGLPEDAGKLYLDVVARAHPEIERRLQEVRMSYEFG